MTVLPAGMTLQQISVEQPRIQQMQPLLPLLLQHGYPCHSLHACLTLMVFCRQLRADAKCLCRLKSYAWMSRQTAVFLPLDPSSLETSCLSSKTTRHGSCSVKVCNFASVNIYSRSSVIALYSKTGGKNGKHAAVTESSNISGLSYVGLQVFKNMLNCQFQPTPEGTALFQTWQFALVPPISVLACSIVLQSSIKHIASRYPSRIARYSEPSEQAKTVCC